MKYRPTEKGSEPFEVYPEMNIEWEEEARRRRRYPAPTRPRTPVQKVPFRRMPPLLLRRPSVGPITVRFPEYRPEGPSGPTDREPQGSPPVPTSTLPSGDNEYVRWVQDSLNRILALSLPVDGMVGPETRSAIRSFQARNGMPQTGIVGPDTEQALISALKSQEYELPDLEWETEVSRSNRDHVRWVQRSLNRILGLRLAEDGRMGPQTRSAIRSFQQQQGLTVDGIVGLRTERVLIASGADQPPLTSTVPVPSAPPTGPAIVRVRGIQVAQQIAPQIEGLLTAAEADGIRLSGGGYRSRERQIELRRQHCGTTHYDIYERPSFQCRPPTAPPGRSMHERGLAIDFTYNGSIINSRRNPAFLWLNDNAPRFGLYNLPSEPWHWSVNGR